MALKLKYAEPWYLGYAFQGAVVLGTAPILLPLIVAQKAGAANAGMVVGGFYLGQLTAPLWGEATDRTKAHAFIFLGGFVLLAAGLALFPSTSILYFWLALAFLQGAGAAASNTVAGMYIVEFQPQSEWDTRIGWLQTFYGAGQAAGLGLAAYLQSRPLLGMLVSAGLMAPGMICGAIRLPKAKGRTRRDPASLTHIHQKPSRSGLSPIHHFHRPTLKGLKGLIAEWYSPFGLFFLSWFLVMFGMWSLFNLYPLVMQKVYGVDPGDSSLYYAVGALVGLFFYAPSGTWGRRFGDRTVYMVGALSMLISMAGLAVLVWLKTGLDPWLAPAAFLIAPVAWSPLIVAGTSVTADLAVIEEGEALGLFNANTALGSVLSAVAAGQLAGHYGYASILPVSAGATLAGFLLSLPLLFMKNAKGRAGNGDAG